MVFVCTVCVPSMIDDSSYFFLIWKFSFKNKKNKLDQISKRVFRVAATSLAFVELLQWFYVVFSLLQYRFVDCFSAKVSRTRFCHSCLVMFCDTIFLMKCVPINIFLLFLFPNCVCAHFFFLWIYNVIFNMKFRMFSCIAGVCHNTYSTCQITHWFRTQYQISYR